MIAFDRHSAITALWFNPARVAPRRTCRFERSYAVIIINGPNLLHVCALRVSNIVPHFAKWREVFFVSARSSLLLTVCPVESSSHFARPYD
jgi:hypothetical protein